MMSHGCVAVLTARGSARILREGGSQAWRLNPRNAAKAEYCVCVQNRNKTWGGADHKHHEAFMVGKIDKVLPVENGRFMIKFIEYAMISVPDAWDGNRNPVKYSTLEDFGISDPSTLDWHKMPVSENLPKEDIGDDEYEKLDDGFVLTIEDAKKGLARTFSVPESSIEINIKF